jgi:hypothetical protein
MCIIKDNRANQNKMVAPWHLANVKTKLATALPKTILVCKGQGDASTR